MLARVARELPRYVIELARTPREGSDARGDDDAFGFDRLPIIQQNTEATVGALHSLGLTLVDRRSG